MFGRHGIRKAIRFSLENLITTGRGVKIHMEDFLRGLFETGDVLLARHLETGCSVSAAELLVKFELVWRSGWPGSPPRFDSEVALAASRVLMALCHAVVFREQGVDESRQLVVSIGLSMGDVIVLDPVQHYSVDLLFQFLPQLLERAKRVSPSDGLIGLILDILKPWPLSSVGVAELSSSSPGMDRIEVIASHPSLWRMYIDRVLERGDRGCLQHMATRSAVSAAIGPYDWLSGKLSGELRELRELRGVMNLEGEQFGE